MEVARHTVDMFWVDLDVAFVGIKLPPPQELDFSIWDVNLFCPCGGTPAEGVTRIAPWYAFLQ